jgi:phosphatidylglycerol:prolipoprotein diacylglycerol transferase
VLGGILAGYLVLRYYKVEMHFRRLVDMIVPNILIAQCIGRWGNFFNQEVYGECIPKSNVSWIPDFILDNMNGGRIYCRTGYVATPLFLYEGILTLLGFILISIVIRKLYTKRVDGQLGAMYLIYYGAIRIIMEPMRNEAYIMKFFGDVSQSVFMSALFIIAGISIIAILEVYRKKLAPVKDAIEEKNSEEENKK